VKYILAAVLPMFILACQSTPSEVTQKVLSDFGLRERPEGYVSVADQVFAALEDVGKVELDRLNREARMGEVKFQEDGLQGMYYREVKKYVRHRGLDAGVISGNSQDQRQYQGHIEYTYHIYQSARKLSRTEVAAEPAEIPIHEEGRIVLRYRFDAAGNWDGKPGDTSRR
jgi:hypothetical protein